MLARNKKGPRSNQPSCFATAVAVNALPKTPAGRSPAPLRPKKKELALLSDNAVPATRIFEIPFKRKGFGERGLNLSVSGAVAQDVPEMARQLVKMVKAMPGWRKRWKMMSPNNGPRAQ